MDAISPEDLAQLSATVRHLKDRQDILAHYLKTSP